MSQETIQYHCFKLEIVSLAQSSIRLEQKFSKNLKSLNFIQILLKLELKNVDHNPIDSRNYAAAYYQTLEKVPGPLLQEKIQEFEKIANIFKNCINS